MIIFSLDMVRNLLTDKKSDRLPTFMPVFRHGIFPEPNAIPKKIYFRDLLADSKVRKLLLKKLS